MQCDIWRALSYVYLDEKELLLYAPIEHRKRLVGLIKDRLFENVWSRMQKYGERTPPFIKSFDSRFLSIDRKVKIFQINEIERGKMSVSGNFFMIYINRNLSFKEKRTALAHELGHTFLYDVDSVPIKPYCDVTVRDIVAGNNREKLFDLQEGFVWEIGRYILIPSPALEKIVPRNPTINDFLDACKNFNVTKDVMARRLFWDVYDIDNGHNYWPYSALFIYPIAKIDDRMLPVPRGNSEIFRGAFFKNFNIKMYWEHLAPIVTYCANNPKEMIKSKDFYEILLKISLPL